MGKRKKQRDNEKDVIIQSPTIEDTGTGYLQLTSASNILFEDNQVYGVTLQNSILDNTKDIYQISSAENLYDKGAGILIDMPANYLQLDNSLIAGTTINPLLTQNQGFLFLSPVNNIINTSGDVLQLNTPIENSLTSLQITTSGSLQIENLNTGLMISPLYNINLDTCGSIRLTTEDNLYIRDDADVYSSQLLTQLNSESLIFKAPENNYLTINVNTDINPSYNGIHVNSILDDSNNLLKTFELNNIGCNLEIGIQECNSIQGRFLDLTNSYSGLYTQHQSGISIIETLPDSLAVGSSLEFYRNTGLVSIVSTEPDKIEIEDESSREQVNDELKEYLATIDPDLNILLDGARDSISSNNPDKVRHAITSMRELVTHVLHHLSPNEEIMKWSKDPNHLDKGKPTRRSRLVYICREINNDKFTDFVKKDIDSTLAFIQLFQRGTHSIKSNISEIQLNAMLFKTESTLSFLIKTGKSL